MSRLSQGRSVLLLSGSVASECGVADVNRHVWVLHQPGPLRASVKRCRGRSRCAGQETAGTRCRDEHYLGNQRPARAQQKRENHATRWSLFERLKATGLPVETGSGGLTKHQRTTRALPKTHWLDKERPFLPGFKRPGLPGPFSVETLRKDSLS
jgi:hypothetical protein